MGGDGESALRHLHFVDRKNKIPSLDEELKGFHFSSVCSHGKDSFTSSKILAACLHLMLGGNLTSPKRTFLINCNTGTFCVTTISMISNYINRYSRLMGSDITSQRETSPRKVLKGCNTVKNSWLWQMHY